jgi:release factor glutamine methyltransferase
LPFFCLDLLYVSKSIPEPPPERAGAVTILEVIRRGTDFLEKKGVPAPRLQVEHLLAHALGMPRMNLYLSFERPLTQAQLDAVRALVQRRGRREPLQYITGSAAFCGLELAVNSNVLAPRPETELLAERAWKFLQETAARNPSPAALDLCAGSGCLAVAIAVNVPAASVHAADASADALAVARDNAARHNARVQFHLGDLFAALPPALRFHLIVSNPPYIPTARLAALDPEVRDHEPRMALDGGADGMDFYRRIAAGAGAFLQPDGRLMLELDDDGPAAASEIFRRQNWVVEAIEPDYNQRPRIMIAHLASNTAALKS